MQGLTLKGLGLIAALSVAANAQTAKESAKASKAGETAAKISDVKEKDKSAKDEKGEDTDKVITNRMMRTQTGSKSMGLSGNFSLGYSMGTVERPLDSVRPNITRGAATRIAPAISGSLGLRYRIDPTANLSFSAGLLMVSPFHEPSNTLGERTFVSDPTLGLTKVFRLGSTQNVTSVSISANTSDQAQLVGAIFTPSLGHTVMYDFGGSRFTAGVSVSLWGTYFDKDASDRIGAPGRQFAVGSEQADLNFGVYPFVEYVFNDRLNWRFLVGQSTQRRRTDRAGNSLGEWTFDANTMYASTGIGISVTRDVFLYPNVQFIPEDVRGDRTNVAIRADFNVF